LDLVTNFYRKESDYEKVVIIWREFWSINDFILQNWGAFVDTIFRHESGWSGRTDRQLRKCCVKPIRRLPIAGDADDRMTGGGCCWSEDEDGGY